MTVYSDGVCLLVRRPGSGVFCPFGVGREDVPFSGRSCEWLLLRLECPPEEYSCPVVPRVTQQLVSVVQVQFKETFLSLCRNPYPSDTDRTYDGQDRQRDVSLSVTSSRFYQKNGRMFFHYLQGSV